MRWWERPAPGGDEALWEAVLRCHEALRARRWSVTYLGRRLERAGHPLRRETLSKILHGRQSTTWATVEAIALVLDVDLGPRVHRGSRSDRGPDEDRGREDGEDA